MFWNFVLEVPTGAVVDFLGRKISLAMGSILNRVTQITLIEEHRN